VEAIAPANVILRKPLLIEHFGGKKFCAAVAYLIFVAYICTIWEASAWQAILAVVVSGAAPVAVYISGKMAIEAVNGRKPPTG
jgi:hypothetical protein